MGPEEGNKGMAGVGGGEVFKETNFRPIESNSTHCLHGCHL